MSEETQATTAPAVEAPPKSEPQTKAEPNQTRSSGRPEPRGDQRPNDPRRGDRPPQGDRRGPRDTRDVRPGGRDDRREGPRGDRRPDAPVEIEIEKLIADSLYLDNQAHAIVARLRDMDSGTKSQLRRLYNAVRRACQAPENERQHEFVMLRARLAYTSARHGLRSLDTIEKLLLQVTRKNNRRGYERFRDLFEAIVAYNE